MSCDVSITRLERLEEWAYDYLPDWFWRCWRFCGEWLPPYMIKRRLKWFWQKRTRGFDDRELWSLEYTIAKYILPRLIAFKEFERMGIPGTFFDEKDIDCRDDKAAARQQEEFLEKSIATFQYLVGANEDDLDSMDMGMNHELPFKEMMKSKNIDQTKMHAYRAEIARRDLVIEEGLQLFAKHFRTLWD